MNTILWNMYIEPLKWIMPNIPDDPVFCVYTVPGLVNYQLFWWPCNLISTLSLYRNRPYSADISDGSTLWIQMRFVQNDQRNVSHLGGDVCLYTPKSTEWGYLTSVMTSITKAHHLALQMVVEMPINISKHICMALCLGFRSEDATKSEIGAEKAQAKNYIMPHV